MTRNRFVLRSEPFGFTLFDRKKMRYKFIQKDTTENLRFSDINVDKSEKWVTNVAQAPKEIIYSPIRVYFELTSACNLRCKHCFNASAKAKPDELNTTELKKTLSGLRNDNVLDIRFSGGEFTQRKDWFDILKYAKNLGFCVSVNTNGIYTNNKSTINKLAALKLNQITFSIDGNQSFHDYIRGNGNYSKTIESLKKLYDKGAHLRINTVLTRGSAKSLEDILKLAGQFVEEINFFYMRPLGRAAGILDNIMSYEELHTFNKKIESLKAQYPDVNILHGQKVTIANSIDSNLKSQFGLMIGGSDGFTRMNLLPNGDIWPGGYTPHLRPDFYLGNIKEEGYTMLNIWRNSSKLKKFRELSWNLQKKCSECPEKNKGCPGASIEMEFYREKNPQHKNPYCIY